MNKETIRRTNCLRVLVKCGGGIGTRNTREACRRALTDLTTSFIHEIREQRVSNNRQGAAAPNFSLLATPPAPSIPMRHADHNYRWGLKDEKVTEMKTTNVLEKKNATSSKYAQTYIYNMATPHPMKQAETEALTTGTNTNVGQHSAVGRACVRASDARGEIVSGPRWRSRPALQSATESTSGYTSRQTMDSIHSFV